MAAKRGKRTASTVPGEASTIGERVEWLLKVIWDGNRSEMARKVGCSQSVISKVVAGTQGVGGKLLADIAAHPKVNPRWLISGIGEPLLASGEAAAGGLVLPIARQPLSGEPDEHRDELSEQTFPVPAAYYRRTRYWLAIERGAPVLNDPAEHIDVGDMLLIEAAREWCKHMPNVDRRLCVVSLSKKDQPPELVRVECEFGAPEEPDILEANCFEFPHGPLGIRFVVDIPPGGSGRKATIRQQAIRPVVVGSKVAYERTNPNIQPRTHRIGLKDIVGACVLMLRRDP